MSPSRNTSQAYPPGLRTLYRESVAQMVETSTSKKKSVVNTRPGTMAANIQEMGRFQNSTMKRERSGEVGRNDAGQG